MKKGNKLQLLLGAGFCCRKRKSMELKQWRCGNCLLCPFQSFLKFSPTIHRMSNCQSKYIVGALLPLYGGFTLFSKIRSILCAAYALKNTRPQCTKQNFRTRFLPSVYRDGAAAGGACAACNDGGIECMVAATGRRGRGRAEKKEAICALY